jgi:hypothetical protein
MMLHRTLGIDVTRDIPITAPARKRIIKNCALEALGRFGTRSLVVSALPTLRRFVAAPAGSPRPRQGSWNQIGPGSGPIRKTS